MNYKKAGLVCLALVLGACSTGGSRTLGGSEVTDVMAAFRSGELRLECDTACSGAWGGARRSAKSYYDNKLWNDLVYEVAKVGFRVDQTYYYLGRSAEGLGYVDAAKTYFNLALANRHKCDGLFNNCDGLDVPKESREGLSRLTRAGLAEAVKAETPKAETPKAETPKAEAPKAEASKAAASKAETPKAETPKAETPKAETPKAETPRENPSVSSLVSTVKVDYDEFKKHTKYQGVDVGSNGDYLALRAWKLDKGQLTIQIYLADYYYGEWRFYHSAHDSDGNKLEFTSISRDVGNCSRYGGCSHTEHVGITVSKSYLESKRSSGIRFKVSGKAGEEIFFFPPEHIAAFLDALKR